MRHRCLFTTWVLCLFAALPSVVFAAGRADDSRPNIVLIMSDDVGVEGFSCYGSESYRTPHIDALAKNGVRFTQCHSQPLCTPSRIKIMTGQSNGRNYVAFSIMDPRSTTFAHVLKRAGYRTAVTGKWQLYGAEHYGKQAKTGMHPSKAGFDEYCLWQIDKLGSRYWNPLIDRNGRIVPSGRDKFGPDVFTDFAVDFMKRNREKPFLLYFPMALVHNPFVTTPKSRAAGAPAEAPKTNRARKGKKANRKKRKGRKRNSQRAHQNFAAMVTHMDDVVGRITRTLAELKLDRNTIVIFTSDNGTNKAITSRMNGRAIRGGKGLTNNRGTHVPLVVSWPGRAANGTVCGDLVDFSDFFPTLLEAAAASPPSDYVVDGRSFLPQILGKTGTPRKWMYCYYNPRPERTKPKRFARTVRYKLYDDGRFFDLSNDVDEKNPLAGDNATPEAKAARAELQKVLAKMPNHPPLRKSR